MAIFFFYLFYVVKGKNMQVSSVSFGKKIPIAQTQIKKQTLLERSGAKVERISYREWHHSPQGCIERIKNIFIEV